ncbi:hypothetical protein CSOJ01_09798 [Colletotrichum sojae]|uniref:Uncharacterized protein n=1 Tax=Colletotrichum sojae TaxID=2175907 RepID=A0A8H6MQZ8_9PEZI|nr:hypothetical protein CSOJ01_09798 [Colletotrichum sojae]
MPLEGRITFPFEQDGGSSGRYTAVTAVSTRSDLGSGSASALDPISIPPYNLVSFGFLVFHLNATHLLTHTTIITPAPNQSGGAART